MINRHLLVAGAALVLTVSAPAAVQAAEMKYTYTGNTFDSGNDLLINPCRPGDAGCDIASITVEFIHEQFPPNQVLKNILATATSWSISDGFTTVTALSPGWNTLFFSVGTGAEAIPVPNDWQFLVFVAGLAGDPTELRTQINVPSAGDLSRYCQADNGVICSSQGTATVAAPGSWTVGPVDVIPPEMGGDDEDDDDDDDNDDDEDENEISVEVEATNDDGFKLEVEVEGTSLGSINDSTMEARVLGDLRGEAKLTDPDGNECEVEIGSSDNGVRFRPGGGFGASLVLRAEVGGPLVIINHNDSMSVSVHRVGKELFVGCDIEPLGEGIRFPGELTEVEIEEDS